MFELWQSEWDEFPKNILHQTLKLCTVCPRTNRNEKSLTARLHVGHSYIAHSFLLKGEERPVCIGCNELLTITYSLLTCWHFYWNKREPFYSSVTACTIWKYIIEKDFNFLKYVNIFWQAINLQNLCVSVCVVMFVFYPLLKSLKIIMYIYRV